MSKKFETWPYGQCIRGNEIIWFDRSYRPIVRCGADVVRPCQPDEWVEHSAKRWLYNDATSPRRNRDTRAKLEGLMREVPELAAEIGRRARVKELPRQRAVRA